MCISRVRPSTAIPSEGIATVVDTVASELVEAGLCGKAFDHHVSRRGSGVEVAALAVVVVGRIVP